MWPEAMARGHQARIGEATRVDVIDDVNQ